MTEDLGENYKRAYDNALGFGKNPALILIDFAQAYFEPGNMLYSEVDDALESAVRIRNKAREAGIPIYYTNVVYQNGGVDGGVFFKKAKPLVNFVKGNPMGDFVKGLDPLPDEPVISKQYPSAFFGTTLAATLTAQKIDTLIITGLTTSGCIRATCIDCCSSGFIPIIVEDACGDRHDAPHQANLFDMNAKYGDVVSESATMEYLEAL